MNGLEVITTIFVGIAAIWRASWITSILYFFTGMLFVASKRFVPDRMHKRQVIARIVFIVLLLDVVFKLIVFFYGSETKKHATKAELDSDIRWYESIGFHGHTLNNAKTEKDYPNGKLELNLLYSLIFEIIVFLILCIFNFLTRRT